MNKTVFIIVCIVSAVIIVALGVSLILLATNSDNSPIDNTVRYDVNIANNETYGSVSGSGEYAENEKVELWLPPTKATFFTAGIGTDNMSASKTSMNSQCPLRRSI